MEIETAAPPPIDKNNEQRVDPAPLDAPPRSPTRRRLLISMLAAPTLTVVAGFGAKDAKAALSVPDALDLGDVMIIFGGLTAALIRLEIRPDGTALLELPRAEVGQGITTAAAMIVAEELGIPLRDVEVRLSPARTELAFGQFTGGSNSVRSLWDPLRVLAAFSRQCLLAAVAKQWGIAYTQLQVRDGIVRAPDGRSANVGAFSAAATQMETEINLDTVAPKHASQYSLLGRETGRIDALEIVTGKAKYATDLDVVPEAKPTVVARAPTFGATVSAYDAAAALAMDGVIEVVQIPSGVAVIADTFGQAIEASQQLRITWTPGPLQHLSDTEISRKLHESIHASDLELSLDSVINVILDVLGVLGTLLEGIVRTLLKGLGVIKTLETSLDFAFVSHAPMETLAAVADVKSDSAEVWYAGKSPVYAQQKIAAALGFAQSKVTVNVIRGGGSFGRRLFADAVIEAAQISKAAGRPVKLMWTRNDDTRKGRVRPACHHRARAYYTKSFNLLGKTYGGTVGGYSHKMTSINTDLSMGLGEALSSGLFTDLPTVASSAFYLLTQKVPYNYGVVVDKLPDEIALDVPTGSWRSVYSGTSAVAHERMTDMLAKELGTDAVAFRRKYLPADSSMRKVLDKVAEAGGWGRKMAPGTAQGVGIWEEYRSAVACLVEIDCTQSGAPRVTKAVIAADVGQVINPTGLKAQLLGGLIDGLSTILKAGLHIQDGAVVEGSFADFHYARMKDSPPHVEIHLLTGDSNRPGGAGELAVPAAAAAVANAYARATGTNPTRFPILSA